MPTTPSPLHDKSVPKRVSKPTITAQAAAAVAESAVAPKSAARKSRASKPKAASPAKKAAPARKAAAAKAAPATKAKAASAGKAGARTGSTIASAPAPAPAKPAKAHKPKLVRDSFTIPKDEYAVLDALKARALGLGQHVRKSELLRAGIQALNAMNDRALLAAIGAVPTLKTGRPKKA